MRDLAELMPQGVTSRIDLTLASSASSVARWTAAGELVHVHPGVVMLPQAATDPLARARAATLWAKGPLSTAPHWRSGTSSAYGASRST